MLFLVVDDDALSRDLLTLLLEAEGYGVEVAASGEVAVTRVTSWAADRSPPPNVILTDIQMPGLTGDPLAKALRAAIGPKTLLLAMSGSQPKPSALTSFDGFLLKPFQMGELRSMIQTSAPVSQAAVLVSEPMSANVPASPALDEEIYEKMCELMPAVQLAQMYALCVDDARKRIADMRALAEAGDDAQYRSEAHAVKGGSGMIGAKELYALAAAAEQDGLAQQEASPGTTSVTATLAQLSLACDRLERILGKRTRG